MNKREKKIRILSDKIIAIAPFALKKKSLNYFVHGTISTSLYILCKYTLGQQVESLSFNTHIYGKMSLDHKS